MWNASQEQLTALAELHTEVVKDYGAACSGFVCDNAKLRDFIAGKVPESAAYGYKRAVAQVRAEKISGDEGMVMKRDDMSMTQTAVNHVNGIIIGVIVLAVLILFVVIIRRRKKSE